MDLITTIGNNGIWQKMVTMVSYSWKGVGIALNIFFSLGSFVMPLVNIYVCKSLEVYTQGL